MVMLGHPVRRDTGSPVAIWCDEWHITNAQPLITKFPKSLEAGMVGNSFFLTGGSGYSGSVLNNTDQRELN